MLSLPSRLERVDDCEKSLSYVSPNCFNRYQEIVVRAEHGESTRAIRSQSRWFVCDLYTLALTVIGANLMNTTTFTIESVHGVKQTLVLGASGTFVVSTQSGKQTGPSEEAANGEDQRESPQGQVDPTTES